jgi:hypothetical protein
MSASTTRLQVLVTEMVCWAAGGPQKYTGRSMKESHEHLSPTLDAQLSSNQCRPFVNELGLRAVVRVIYRLLEFQYRCAGLSIRQSTACRLVQAREPATGIIVIDTPAVLDRADAIRDPPGVIEFKR